MRRNLLLSYCKNDTRLTKNLSRAKRRSHGTNDNHSQLLTWTWNMALINPQRSLWISRFFIFGGFFFCFFFWRYHFHWSRKKCQRNLQPSLHSQGQTCQRDARILAPHCTHFDIKCQLFHHMNICRAGLCAPHSDQSYSGCKKKKREKKGRDFQKCDCRCTRGAPTRPFLWVQRLASQGGTDGTDGYIHLLSVLLILFVAKWRGLRSEPLPCVSPGEERNTILHHSLFAWVVSKMLRI